jgi:uncharacterized heparinase superfamily protein
MRVPSGHWKTPIAKTVCVLGGNRFRYLNREATLDFPLGWNHPGLDKLWLYNLHYFDDLSAHGGDRHGQTCRTLMEQWILENPPTWGNGWESYPLSLRIVNWLKHHLSGGYWPETVQESLAIQVRVLEQRIEWHLLANHLLANGKALVFAGLCFGGPEGERWLRKGLNILARELHEQVLADGGHIERSPMYQAIILEDLLDLINLAAARPGLIGDHGKMWEGTANKMRAWLDAMSHPDGEISFFNDCAFGVAPRPAELEAYAERLHLPALPARNDVVDLAASGYVRATAGSLTLFFDAAPIGPDYQPGHAHADTLSLELSAGRDRVLVNGGVSTYELGPDRTQERATSAHNTVEIDDENSSEVWAAFRVGRRARILTRSIRRNERSTVLEASHSGYQRLPGKPIHHRVINCAENQIIITDWVEGAFSKAITRFRLAPGLVARLNHNGCAGVVLADNRPIAEWSSSRPARVHPIMHATAFNVREPTSEIQIAVDQGGVEVVWRAAE